MIWKGFFSCIKSKKKLWILDEWYNYCSEKKFPLKIKYEIKIFTNVIIAILIIISKLLKMALTSNNFFAMLLNFLDSSMFLLYLGVSIPLVLIIIAMMGCWIYHQKTANRVQVWVGFFCQTQPAIINYMLFKVTIFHWERIFMKEDIFWCNWNRVKHYRKLMFFKFILKPFTWWLK